MRAGRRWKFFDAVYHAQFYVYRCPYETFVAECRRRWKLEQSSTAPSGKALAHICPNGARLYILWLPPWNRARSVYHIGIVAHEVTHLTMYVLLTRGVNADSENHEPYCYYLEWLLAETLKRLRA